MPRHHADGGPPVLPLGLPAGQRLIGSLVRQADGSADDRTYLTSVAVRGVHAIGEPDLRAAFAHRERYVEERWERRA